jgi:hypothetical protein
MGRPGSEEKAGVGSRRGVPARGEQVERSPGVPPVAARPDIEDDEVHALATQVVAGGEPGLAAADHYYAHGVRHGAVATARASNFLRQASAT